MWGARVPMAYTDQAMSHLAGPTVDLGVAYITKESWYLMRWRLRTTMLWVELEAVGPIKEQVEEAAVELRRVWGKGDLLPAGASALELLTASPAFLGCASTLS